MTTVYLSLIVDKGDELEPSPRIKLSTVCHLIESHLAEHPEHTPDVFAAVTRGSAGAIQSMREKLGTMAMALNGAMLLGDGKCIGPEMTQTLNEMIAKAFSVVGSNMTPTERTAFLAAAEAMKQ